MISTQRKSLYYAQLVVMSLILGGITAVFVLVLTDPQKQISTATVIVAGLFFSVFWNLFLNTIQRVWSARDMAWNEPALGAEGIGKAIDRVSLANIRRFRFSFIFMTAVSAVVFCIFFLTKPLSDYGVTTNIKILLGTIVGYLLARYLILKFFPGLKKAGGGWVSYTAKPDRISLEFSFFDFGKRGMSSISHDVMFSDLSEVIGFQNPVDAHTYFGTALGYNSEFRLKSRPAEFNLYKPGFQLRYYANAGSSRPGARDSAPMSPAILLKGPDTLLFIFLKQDAQCADAVEAFEKFKQSRV